MEGTNIDRLAFVSFEIRDTAMEMFEGSRGWIGDERRVEVRLNCRPRCRGSGNARATAIR